MNSRLPSRKCCSTTMRTAISCEPMEKHGRRRAQRSTPAAVIEKIGRRRGMLDFDDTATDRVRLEFTVPSARPVRLPQRVHDRYPRRGRHERRVRSAMSPIRAISRTRNVGALVAFETRRRRPCYGLFYAQDRGTLFCGPDTAGLHRHDRRSERRVRAISTSTSASQKHLTSIRNAAGAEDRDEAYHPCVP